MILHKEMRLSLPSVEDAAEKFVGDSLPRRLKF